MFFGKELCEMCRIEAQIMVAKCKVVDEKYVVYVSKANAHKVIILDDTYVNETNVHKILFWTRKLWC